MPTFCFSDEEDDTCGLLQGSNHSVDIYGKIMWLFVLNHLKKYTETETWSIYDDILDLRVPSGCRRLLAIYERNQR